MDNEMIERCAEAYGGCKLAEWHPNVQEQIKETIINIIKAMREPTEKMLVLGPEVQAWPEIIDSILND